MLDHAICSRYYHPVDRHRANVERYAVCKWKRRHTLSRLITPECILYLLIRVAGWLLRSQSGVHSVRGHAPSCSCGQCWIYAPHRERGCHLDLTSYSTFDMTPFSHSDLSFMLGVSQGVVFELHIVDE